VFRPAGYQHDSGRQSIISFISFFFCSSKLECAISRVPERPYRQRHPRRNDSGLDCALPNLGRNLLFIEHSLREYFAFNIAWRGGGEHGRRDSWRYDFVLYTPAWWHLTRIIMGQAGFRQGLGIWMGHVFFSFMGWAGAFTMGLFSFFLQSVEL
jgi:hypothetical protein